MNPTPKGLKAIRATRADLKSMLKDLQSRKAVAYSAITLREYEYGIACVQQCIQVFDGHLTEEFLDSMEADK